MDETTVGIDPQSVRMILDMVKEEPAADVYLVYHPLHGGSPGAVRPGRDHRPR